MGFFRHSNTFSMLELDFCRTLGILKGQIEDKKYFLEWSSNPEIVLLEQHLFRAEIKKKIGSVFGSNENCRICF